MSHELKISKDLYRPNWYYLLILLFALLIAYWPVAFHVFSLKNDALTYFLPTRTVVSEAYFNHRLPLWSPYINLGYPIHADMQGGVWNPFVQLISLFGVYDLHTLQLETLFYIYLCGAGMFFLLRYFHVHPYANLVACAGFMLCGFNSDSCQFLYWIAGNAFFVFVFLNYYRLLNEQRWVNAVATALPLYLFLVCGSPADFILNAYVMLAMLVIRVVQSVRAKTFRQSWKKLLLLHLTLFILFLLLSAPALISYLQGLPLMRRGSGISYEDALSNPLYPPLIVSMITPLASLKMPGAGITDPLERNMYLGIAALLFIIIAYARRSSVSLITFSKWAAIIFLVFSFGQYGGLRPFTYRFLPLMDTFRHPANAKMFTLFFLSILAAYGFHDIINAAVNPKKIKAGFIILVSVFGVLLVWALVSPFNLLSGNLAFHSSFSLSALKSRMEAMSFGDLVVLNIILQLPFLILIGYWLIRKPSARKLLLLGVLNSIFFTMIFQPITVVRNERASTVQRLISAERVKGDPIPSAQESILDNCRQSRENYLMIGPVNIYNKKIGRSIYFVNPGNLEIHVRFWDKIATRNEILKLPFLNSPNAHAAERARITSFNPREISGTTNGDTNEKYSIMQTFHPNWKLTIDGKAAPIVVANLAFIGFTVPQGQHSFTLTYQAAAVPIAFWISLVTLIGTICFLIIISSRSSPSLPY